MRKKDAIKIGVLHFFFVSLLAIGLRHHLIEGDVLWTDEGSVMSWHMLLKSKNCGFFIRSGSDGWKPLDLGILAPWQRNLSDPLLLLSYVKQTHCPQLKTVSVRALCGSVTTQVKPLLDEQTDLCQVSYSYWRHNSWIDPAPGERVSEFELRQQTRRMIQ